MAVIVLQAGHCHRRTGVVGTRAANGFTEQQFTWPVANKAAQLLNADGHLARVILADPPSTRSYAGEAFVAVHADGNNSPSVGGASVGYRTEQGKALAHAWKAAYRALGWTGGFRNDNYTDALSGYYGTKRAVALGNRRACIIEAGFLTNPAEAAQLSSEAGQDRCAQAIRRAVNAMFGVASTTPAPQEDPLVYTLDEARDAVRGAYTDIVGRTPDGADAEMWAHAIAADPRKMFELQGRLFAEMRGDLERLARS